MPTDVTVVKKYISSFNFPNQQGTRTPVLFEYNRDKIRQRNARNTLVKSTVILVL